MDTKRQRGSRIGFSVALTGSGIAHFLIPKFFIALIPAVVPGRRFWVFASGAVEIGVGVGLWIRPIRRLASVSVLLLMLMFLPLHIIDVFRSRPVTGSKPAALVRLLIQFVLIALAGDLTRSGSSTVAE
jgi:uncharacterized membrane protein